MLLIVPPTFTRHPICHRPWVSLTVIFSFSSSVKLFPFITFEKYFNFPVCMFFLLKCMLILCSFQEDFIEREWMGGERGDMVSEAPPPPTPSYRECFSTFCQPNQKMPACPGDVVRAVLAQHAQNQGLC